MHTPVSRVSIGRTSMLCLWGIGIAALCLASGCACGVKPFNGHDLTGWQALDAGNNAWCAAGNVEMNPEDTAHFTIQDGAGMLVNGPVGKTSNLYTEQQFGDCKLHIEFMVPKGSNSGVYLQGRYEIQVFDSFNKPRVDFTDCGGIYAEWVDQKDVRGHAPRVNASRPAGQWQCFDAIFRAPRFDQDGKKIGNARFVEVKHNGEIVQTGVELFGPTRAHMPGEEAAEGPLMLQGDHGPVVYRNIRITPLARAK